MKFNKLYLIPLAAVILALGAFYMYDRSGQSNAAGQWQVFDGETSETAEAAETGEQTIKIYITGAVENPDVYELPSGSRVVDALQAAGGAASGAALDAINLSAKIADEAHIRVPWEGEDPEQDAGSPGSADAAGSGKVNINAAGSAELQTLSGIGPVMAERIIAYREANGGFKSIDELKKVDRIGEKTFEGIKDYVAVD